jgi:23S rRNA pseudouridine2605 synthase
MPEERLQKLLALAGLGSRRESESIIKQNRVTVNGEIASLGAKADPERDDIRVDGKPLDLPEAYDYILLNKPRGVISDEDVAGNWPAARELIPVEGHLFPVGRLDVPSEGLMLFTNDGDLAYKLTHPSYEHPKVYRVQIEGHPDDATLEAWRRGVGLNGKRTLPAEVQRVKKTRDATELEITLREGRKRQIRRVAAQLGHPVKRIERIGLGPLRLGDLPSGAWRRLTEEEVAALRAVRKQSKPRRRSRR